MIRTENTDPVRQVGESERRDGCKEKGGRLTPEQVGRMRCLHGNGAMSSVERTFRVRVVKGPYMYKWRKKKRTLCGHTQSVGVRVLS